MVKRVFAALLSLSLFWLCPPLHRRRWLRTIEWRCATCTLLRLPILIAYLWDLNLVINFPDTGESQTVEVVDVSNIGQDVELDLYFSSQNQHYIVEVSRDGISTLFR